MFSQEHIKEMLATIEPKLLSDRHDFEYETPGTFFPQDTKLLWSLAARGDAVGKRVCFHPLLKRYPQRIATHAHHPNEQHRLRRHANEAPRNPPSALP